MDVDNRAVRGIDEKRGLYRLNLLVTPVAVVIRRLLAVEVGGVDGGVAGLVKQLRRASEQLAPDTHRRSVKQLAQRRWAGELAALEDERGSYPLYLFGPVKDFDERRVHVKPEKVQDGVLPAGDSVAGGMADLHHCTISKFSCYRDGLLNEAEEDFLHKDASFASLPSFYRTIATPSVDSIEPPQAQPLVHQEVHRARLSCLQPSLLIANNGIEIRIIFLVYSMYMVLISTFLYWFVVPSGRGRKWIVAKSKGDSLIWKIYSYQVFLI
jgi:hypothetical protein